MNMPQELRAFKIEKNNKVATIITNKMVFKDDPDDFMFNIYSFEKLTSKEMDKFAKELNDHEIPFKTYMSKGTREIQIKEIEIDSFHIKEPEYEECTKKQLIMLLEQKNMQMQNIRFQHDNLHKAYSKLYHFYVEKN